MISHYQSMTTPYLISHSIDAICYDIIWRPEFRKERRQNLKTLLMQVNEHKLQGRLQCVNLLANLILKLEIGIETEVENDNDIPTETQTTTTTTQLDDDDLMEIDDWYDREWNDFVAQLCELRQLLYTNDVTTFTVAPLIHYEFGNSSTNSNNNTINENVSSNGDPTNTAIVTNNNNNNNNNNKNDNKNDESSNQQRISTLEKLDSTYENVLDLSHFQWAMSYIRFDVEDVMNATKGTKLHIIDDEIEKMYALIQEKFNEGNIYYDKLHSLFQNTSTTTTNNNNQPQLKEVTELYHIMTNQCPSLQKFRKNTIRLLQNWYMNVFDEPFFVKIGFATSYHDNTNDGDDNKIIDFHDENGKEVLVDVHEKEMALVEDDDRSTSSTTHGSTQETIEKDQDLVTPTSNNKKQNTQLGEGDGESEGATQYTTEKELKKAPPSVNDYNEKANASDENDEFDINNDDQTNPSNDGEDDDDETEEEEDFRLLQTQEIPHDNEFKDSVQTTPDDENEDNSDKEGHHDEQTGQKTKRLTDEFNGVANDPQDEDGNEDDTTYATCEDVDNDDDKSVKKKPSGDSIEQESPSYKIDEDDSDEVDENDSDKAADEDDLIPKNEIVRGKRKRQKTRRYIDEFNGVANSPNNNNDNDDRSSSSTTTTKRSSPKRQRRLESPRIVNQHRVIYSPLNNRKRTRVVFDVIECNRVTSETIQKLKEETTKRIWDQLDNLLEQEQKKKEDEARKMPSDNLTFTDDDDNHDENNNNDEELNEEGKNEEVGDDETGDELETQEERQIEETQAIDQLETQEERPMDENEEGTTSKTAAVEDEYDSDFEGQDDEEEEVDDENNEQYYNQNEENMSKVKNMQTPTTAPRSGEEIIRIQDSSEDQSSQQHSISQDSSVLSERSDLMNGRPQLKTPQPHYKRIEMIPSRRGRQNDYDEHEEAENDSSQENLIRRQRERNSKNKKRKKPTSGGINSIAENSSSSNTNAATAAGNDSDDTNNNSDDDPDHRSRVTTTKGKKRARTRNFWTPMEKDCVKKGFQKYGYDWVKIKDMYSSVFINRTNVQIKDCFRSMQKRGEI